MEPVRNVQGLIQIEPGLGESDPEIIRQESFLQAMCNRSEMILLLVILSTVVGLRRCFCYRSVSGGGRGGILLTRPPSLNCKIAAKKKEAAQSSTVCDNGGHLLEQEIRRT